MRSICRSDSKRGTASVEHCLPWLMTGKSAGELHQELTRCGLVSRLEADVVSISFYNQNRNWQIEQQRWSDTFSSSSMVTSVLSNALTSQSAGLAAISNQRALARVKAQLKAAATSIVNGLSPAQFAQLQASATASQSTSSSLKTTQASSSAQSSLNLLA
jgi:hypothetical protein